MKFYRYTDMQYEDGPHLYLEEFVLIKETPCGWWIRGPQGHFLSISKKWVSKTARKRFAYPSREEALEGFRHRKHRQVVILRDKLKRAERALILAGGKIPTDWPPNWWMPGD